jgi:hypothetical protein
MNRTRCRKPPTIAEKILKSLHKVLKELKLMSASLDALTAQVAENTSAEESAITLINNIAAALAAAGTDPAALAELQRQLKVSGDALAAAVVANTAAAPAKASKK